MKNKNESNLGAWIDMAEGLYDFLNRRNATINYDFKQLCVSVPQSTGDGFRDVKCEYNRERV